MCVGRAARRRPSAHAPGGAPDLTVAVDEDAGILACREEFIQKSRQEKQDGSLALAVNSIDIKLPVTRLDFGTELRTLVGDAFV